MYYTLRLWEFGVFLSFRRNKNFARRHCRSHFRTFVGLDGRFDFFFFWTECFHITIRRIERTVTHRQQTHKRNPKEVTTRRAHELEESEIKPGVNAINIISYLEQMRGALYMRPATPYQPYSRVIETTGTKVTNNTAETSKWLLELNWNNFGFFFFFRLFIRFVQFEIENERSERADENSNQIK